MAYRLHNNTIKYYRLMAGRVTMSWTGLPLSVN